jgi:hypothetical protein
MSPKGRNHVCALFFCTILCLSLLAVNVSWTSLVTSMLHALYLASWNQHGKQKVSLGVLPYSACDRFGCSLLLHQSSIIP